MPIGKVELCLRAVDDGFSKAIGKADRRVVNLIVVGVVVHLPAEIVGVQLEFSEERFRQTRLVVISFGRLHRQAEEIPGSEGFDLR